MLKLMTSQGVERTWIRTGGYGQFRDEWLNRFSVLVNLVVADFFLPGVSKGTGGRTQSKNPFMGEGRWVPL